MIAAGFIFQVGDDDVALSWPEFVQSCCCLFEFGFLATGDDDCSSVLDEALSGHLTEAGRAARDEGDMVLEVEDVGNCEVGAAGVHFDRWGAQVSVLEGVGIEKWKCRCSFVEPRFNLELEGKHNYVSHEAFPQISQLEPLLLQYLPGDRESRGLLAENSGIPQMYFAGTQLIGEERSAVEDG